jgi:hypothetical protein
MTAQVHVPRLGRAVVPLQGQFRPLSVAALEADVVVAGDGLVVVVVAGQPFGELLVERASISFFRVRAMSRTSDRPASISPTPSTPSCAQEDLPDDTFSGLDPACEDREPQHARVHDRNSFELGWLITDKRGLRRTNINELNHALRSMLWNEATTPAGVSTWLLTRASRPENARPARTC